MRFPAYMFLLALGLRVGFVLWYPQFPFGTGDDALYDEVARNLAAGKGFIGGFAADTSGVPDDPEIGIGPIYPLFLALIYLVFGHSLTAVRVIQAILSAAVLWILYPHARDAFGERVAKISAAFMALYPAFIIYSGMVFTETLFLFLLALLVSMIIRAVQTQSPGRWARVGVMMGVCILLRQETLAMVPLFVGLVLWQFRRRGVVRDITVLLVVTMLTVSPWTARNYFVFRDFILVAAHGGDTMWISTKGWLEWDIDDPEFRSLTDGLNYMERSKVLRREAVRNIVSAPLYYSWLCIKRLPAFWVSSHTSYLTGFGDTYKQLYNDGAYGRLLLKALLLGANICLIAMAALGIITTLKPRDEKLRLRLFLLIPIALIATVHFFLFATHRYNVPIMPFVLIFTSATLWEIAVPKIRPLAHHFNVNMSSL